MSNFKHSHAAHCESGAVAAMLTHSGLNMSEAMCFGLSSAIVFAYFPFIKVNDFPLVSYRMPPRFILKSISKNIGAKFDIRSFKNDQAKAARELDKVLEKGEVAGVQTSVFYLPYFPKDMRFHFNAHNLIVFKKEGDTYLVSDPVFDFVNTIKEEDLLKARFAKGVLAPHGAMYTLAYAPKSFDLHSAVKRALKKTNSIMLHTPLPIIGIRGMKTMSKKLSSLKTDTPQNLKIAKFFAINLIRMQEEIGTGGGGFRYMYGAFLQECGKALDSSLLLEASEMMSEAGDKLRNFALEGAKMIKDKEKFDIKELGNIYYDCAISEELVYKKLKHFK